MTVSDNWTELTRLLAPLAGRRVLDAGCGRGALAQALEGAEVAALDPEPQAVAARRMAPTALVVRALAERLPFVAGRFDTAILLNSLRHVPGPAMAALAEGLRVLRPGGSLVVIEPLAEGPFFEPMRPLEDETAIQVEALAAVAGFAQGGRAARVAAVRESVAERFARLGTAEAAGTRLDQPPRLHHFRPAGREPDRPGRGPC